MVEAEPATPTWKFTQYVLLSWRYFDVAILLYTRQSCPCHTRLHSFNMRILIYTLADALETRAMLRTLQRVWLSTGHSLHCSLTQLLFFCVALELITVASSRHNLHGGI